MSENRQAIIRLFRVSQRYGPRNALENISCDIDSGSFVFVTGPSGAGKTTLLKLLYLGIRATEGQVLVDGMNLDRLRGQRVALLRRKLGLVFQDFKLIETRSVFDNVALVLEAVGGKRRVIEKKVRQVLHSVGMADRLDALPPSLSGGEQQRVAVARAVVGEPKILLADEPTGSLDAEAAAVVMDLIQRFHRRGGTVVVATHDRPLIRSVPARVIRLDHGRMVVERNE